MTYQIESRECLWCEAPIQGRADKQFCSSACKARYHREHQSENFTESISTTSRTGLVQLTSPAYLTRDQAEPLAHHTSGEDEASQAKEWVPTYESLQLIQYSRGKAEQLHALHTRLVTRFLREEDRVFGWKALEHFLDELNKALEEYREHPGLRLAQHPARNRMKDLYRMQDYLRELGEAMKEAKKETNFFFGRVERRYIRLVISKKHRKKFRENLLGEV